MTGSEITPPPLHERGVMINMNINDNRRRIAMLGLRSRLMMSIRFKRTDSVALNSARGWADRKFNTSKQALAWVEEQIEDYNKLDRATSQAQQYFERLVDLSEETQTQLIFDAITYAFMHGWTPPSDPDNPETSAD